MWGGLLLQDLERSISLPPFFSHKQAYGSGSEVSTLPLMSGSLDHQAEARPWRGRLRKCSSICSWSGFWMHWGEERPIGKILPNPKKRKSKAWQEHVGGFQSEPLLCCCFCAFLLCGRGSWVGGVGDCAESVPFVVLLLISTCC